MSEGFIHGSLRNIYLRNATVLDIYQNDTHNLLEKPFHIKIGAVNRLSVSQGSR